MTTTPAPTILVADDEADLRRLAVRRLERAEYRVLEAGDGEAAWESIVAQRPAVVVLDVRMPRLDGYELTRRIRADERTSATGIVLLTASAREHEERLGLEAGADHYLRKPFRPAELLDVVAGLVETGGAA